jgi:hypothetical protein
MLRNVSRACVLLLLPLVGCSVRTHPEALRVYQGSYTFDGQVDDQPVQGRLTFKGESYFMESTLGTCTAARTTRMQRPVRERVTFGCRDFSIEFQVVGDVFAPRAQAMIRRTVQTGFREQCMSYAWDPDRKQQVCESTVQVPVQRAETRRGVVEVKRGG